MKSTERKQTQRTDFLDAVYFRRGLTCTLDLIDGGQPRDKSHLRKAKPLGWPPSIKSCDWYTLVSSKTQKLRSCSQRNDHSDPILRILHWLPINERLTFKLLVFTYKALNGLAPIYISELLEPYRPPRLLRSAKRNLLKVPNTRTITYGNRAFS